MKTRWIALLAAGALGGCVPADFVVPRPSATTPSEGSSPKSATARQTYAPPVTAGEITTNNARDKAQSLRAEIDADLTGGTDSNGKKDKD
jgi:hypothetical protein